MKFTKSVETMDEAIQRFLSKCDSSEDSKCWSWQAGRLANGYGHFYYNKKSVKAHRFAYEVFSGDIPTGYSIDHLCTNKSCVNPNHLEAVTSRENTLRCPNAPATINRNKKVCARGHALIAANVWRDRKQNSRHCRLCWDVRRYGFIRTSRDVSKIRRG